MDLHNVLGGVPSHVSQGHLALTFLRSTCPRVEAEKAPKQGHNARMVKNFVRLLRALFVMNFRFEIRDFEIRLLGNNL